MKNINRLKHLYTQYKSREITEDEFNELTSLINEDVELENQFVNMIEQDLLNNEMVESPTIDRIVKQSEENILSRTKNNNTPKLKLPIYIVAASIIIILAASIIYLKDAYQSQHDSTIQQISNVEDIKPGGNIATLKLSDGSTYSLNDEHNQVSIANNAILLNDDSKLTDLSESIVQIELSTPRKGNYQAILPDGTKVWLNAASTIHYPSKFSSEERVIKVEGEVYLEVAKVNNSKFIIELSQDRKIEVLGTKFNVSAYSDQNYLKTSLLEGKVKISNSNNISKLLKPGQKAIQYNHAAHSIEISSTNIENDLAWLDNKFNFEDLTFEEIMKQIARWYDVNVVYETKVPNVQFYGELNKKNSLKYLIDVFKQSGVNMRIKNKDLIVE